MTQPRRLALLAPAIAAGLFLSACGTTPDEPAPEAPLTGTPAPTSPGTSASAPTAENGGAQSGTATGYEAVLAAVALAEAEAGGTAFELDDADGGTWEVHVAAGGDELEVHVSSDGMSVLSVERDSRLDSDEADALARAQVSLSAAIEIAVTEYGGSAPVEQVDLSDERSDNPIWDVEFDDDFEVHVSIVDGAILYAGS